MAQVKTQGATAGSQTRHALPQLPYDFSALEPHIDTQTMQIHHGKHHQTYVTNLNNALAKHPDLFTRSLDDLLRNVASLPDDIRTAVRNNGGGHHNHSLFWTILAPEGTGGERSPELNEALNQTFGDFAKFKESFTAAAVGVFGSGWAWLTVRGGRLVLGTRPNQDSPVMDGETPIFGLDVWEHAYYLKYQNRRPDYIAAWWNVVNWNEVNRRFVSTIPRARAAP